MKTKIMLLFFPVLAILSFAGCGGRHTYDVRLAVADSILRCNDPDSALKLLTAIDGGCLSNASDRAYHALLLTQAQYRCYVDITSDSTINIALDYYQHHADETEKLTRAYIYKGAVMAVLDDPEKAMTYFKQAASTASPSDHYNLGYAMMRIGGVFRDYLAADSSDINYFKQALHHFEQVPDSFYIANCLSTIGGCYAARDMKDSAIFYLERADILAKALDLKELEQDNLIYLIDLKMFSRDVHQLEEAKSMTTSILNGENYIPDRNNHLFLAAAFTLAKLNKSDSATWYLQQADSSTLSKGLKVLHERCMAEIALRQGDINQYQYYFERADILDDSLMSNDIQRQLRDIEAKYDNEVLKNKSLRYRNSWIMSLLATVLIVVALGAVILAMRRRLQRRRRQLQESEDTIERLRNDAIQLSTQLSENHAMSDSLKETISKQIESFTQLVDVHFKQFTHFPKKFGDLFKKSYTVNQPDPSFWTGIRAYADSTHNGIVTHSLEKCPSLSETEVRFLSLCCCNLPITVMMACMGYNDVHSVYNKKRRLAEALGINDKLDEYIEQFRS